MFEQLPLSYYLSANTMTHVYQRKRHLGKHNFNNMIKNIAYYFISKTGFMFMENRSIVSNKYHLSL